MGLSPGAGTSHQNLVPGPYLRLTVKDSGHGMDTLTLERIFDPYFTAKGVGERSGLGAVCGARNSKCSQRGGHSHERTGKGSTFQIFIPRADSSLAVEGQPAGPAPMGNETILLVDDEEALGEMTRKMLERLGYKVVAESSSEAILEVFRSRHDQFDLAITDLNMPHMTGIDLATEMLHICPDIPIIMCTGHDEIVSKEKARNAGIRELLTKPASMRDIAGIIRKVMEQV